MSSTGQVNATIASANGHGNSDSNSNSRETPMGHTDNDQLQILGQLRSIEQINEQRRIFLKSTINEIQEENGSEPAEEVPELRRQVTPPNSLALSVKYATLPSPSLATSTMVRSPLSPPPKPPMLSRTRSTGSGDARSPLGNGEAVVLRHSVTEAGLTPAATTEIPAEATPTQPALPATISSKHYESLIEELRCPGCASPMKAPVLLCKSGHSVCEQCTRIRLMCPLCKEGFTTLRSLTIEALCAKAHFGCSFAAGGCVVRMPVALLPWHEQQCIYKPMKCFMGRVWGDCKWHGREVQWKQHLEEQHKSKLFCAASADLVWNMAKQIRPLTGYYVFQAFDEMFNFYEIYDKERILFTMTCTSNRRETKYNYAYEVTLLQPNNEALSLTQKFPVHSEYDKDILLEGTCVSIGLNELSRFVDDDKLLHYRVTVMAVRSPRHSKPMRQSLPQPLNYQQPKIAGVNGKSVPPCMIITRTYKEAIGEVADTAVAPVTPDGETSESGTSLELERKWGTPQLHFNRKYLNTCSDVSNDADAKEDVLRPLHEPHASLQVGNDDKLSMCSNTTSYTKKVSNSLRRSIRSLKCDLMEMRPFAKKKSTATTAKATASATKTT
ncbi:PREDICTED: uncharacterized protein LOC108618797 [Drosophila arizonae]|uniref:Uncharacterized protein LOC108618797 n=1 Tax=Drosophila arizonae TaxID=7263 RepID=A0ABM1PT88_DROAR|nr:PREDICTED: uncharacterized protein LOC108618797 [Drosophila arizonae]